MAASGRGLMPSQVWTGFDRSPPGSSVDRQPFQLRSKAPSPPGLNICFSAVPTERGMRHCPYTKGGRFISSYCFNIIFQILRVTWLKKNSDTYIPACHNKKKIKAEKSIKNNEIKLKCILSISFNTSFENFFLNVIFTYI